LLVHLRTAPRRVAIQYNEVRGFLQLVNDGQQQQSYSSYVMIFQVWIEKS
jgi:hypothetical protein